MPANKFESLIKKIYENNTRDSKLDLYKLIEKEIIEDKKNDKIWEFEMKSKILEEEENNRKKRNLKDLHFQIESHIFKFYSQNFDNKKFFYCLNQKHNYFLKFKFNYFQNNKQVKISTNFNFKNCLNKKLFIKIVRKKLFRIRKNSSDPLISKTHLSLANFPANKINKCISQERFDRNYSVIFEKQLNPEEKVKKNP